MIDENDMFGWMMENNLGWAALFHNHIDAVLKEKAKEIPISEELDEKDKRYWKDMYENNFPEKLRETTYLLMFGHCEEMLYLLWRDKNSKSIPLDKGHGITKFKSYIKDVLGIELGNCSDYQYLSEAQKVRNSLLHIAGRVSLSKEKEALEAIVKRNPNLYSINLDRIKISYDGLLGLQKAIRGLTKTLLNNSIQPTANAPAD